MDQLVITSVVAGAVAAVAATGIVAATLPGLVARSVEEGVRSLAGSVTRKRNRRTATADANVVVEANVSTDFVTNSNGETVDAR